VIDIVKRALVKHTTSLMMIDEHKRPNIAVNKFDGTENLKENRGAGRGVVIAA